MILRRQQICEYLGVATWKTARARLRQLGVEPKRAGREVYVTDAQLEQATGGTQKPSGFTPKWEDL